MCGLYPVPVDQPFHPLTIGSQLPQMMLNSDLLGAQGRIDAPLNLGTQIAEDALSRVKLWRVGRQEDELAAQCRHLFRFVCRSMVPDNRLDRPTLDDRQQLFLANALNPVPDQPTAI